MQISIVQLLIFLLFSQTIFCAERLAENTDYVEHESSNGENREYIPPSVDLPALSESDLKTDLKSSSSVRAQIAKNLSLYNKLYHETFFKLPILCIGTGLNVNMMSIAHRHPTHIRSIDISMDCNYVFSPHYVCDCFFLNNVDNLPQNHRFGIIFFAHVEKYGLPTLEKNKFSMSKYKEFLIDDGLLIYNSAVIDKAGISIIVKKAGVNSFDELKQKWRSLLTEIGFVDIEILEKDESELFYPNTISILIIAKKKVENSI